jgi:spore cortex biosynthesis protein YabQ
MSELVSLQAHVFLFSVAGGAVIAFVYDIFRIFRKTVKTKNTVIYIQDMLFWIIVALLMFTLVYISNEGELRSYIILGAGIGAVLYMLLLSKIVIGCSIFIIGVLAKIFRFIVVVVAFPIKIVIKIISVPASATGRLSVKAARKIRRLLKNRFSKAGIYRKILKNASKKI